MGIDLGQKEAKATSGQYLHIHGDKGARAKSGPGPIFISHNQQADMQVKIYHSFAADGTYWHAQCFLEEDPNLSVGDVIEPVDNMWPATVDEVNYIVEEDKKIYSLNMERGQEKDFLDKARKSDKWNLTSEQT